MVNPECCVSRQVEQSFRDQLRRYANVFLGPAKAPRPTPRAAEHATMQFTEEGWRYYRFLASTTAQPVHRRVDVDLLPRIELAAIGQVRRDQVSRLVFIKRRISVGPYFRGDGTSSSQMCRDQSRRSFS